MTVRPVSSNTPSTSATNKSTQSSSSGSQFKDISKRDANKRPNDRPERASNAKSGMSTHSPLLAQADGSFVIGHFMPTLPGSVGSRTAPARPKVATAAPIDHGMLQNVKVGQAGGVVRLHATLGEGQHRGVELRAVEKHGKVQVELLAQDPDAARRLRADLGEIREILSQRGLEGVDVSVVTQGSRSTEHGIEESSASANAGNQREQEEHNPQEQEQTSLQPVTGSHASNTATPESTTDEQDLEAWELL